MTDSDYESDPGLEIADIHATSGEINDRHNDSDTEDISHPPVLGRPSGLETIPSARRPLGEAAGYTELNKAMTDDPWSPFSFEDDFNLASWFVRSKVAKSQINTYFAQGLSGTDSGSFRPPIPCDNTSTYWTHFVNTWCGRKLVLMMLDMQQLCIIQILLTVSAA